VSKFHRDVRRIHRIPPRGHRPDRRQGVQGFQVPRARRDDQGGRAAATLAAAVAAVAATPDAALAFGSGIPGYDINQKARDAQRDMIKREQTEQRELARKEKERRRLLREQEEAEACAADPSACPTPAEN
jgi:hypothetical protein